MKRPAYKNPNLRTGAIIDGRHWRPICTQRHHLKLSTVTAWCLQNSGQRHIDWDYVIFDGVGRNPEVSKYSYSEGLWFRRTEDATLFTLQFK